MQELIQFCNTDRQREILQSVIDDHVKEAMRKAADMPKGTAGICDGRGEFFPRLVDEMCGRRRDKFAKYYAR